MTRDLTLARPPRLRVVVPAHDEEELLPGCLAALDPALDAVRAVAPGLDAAVVVVADACRDRTAGVARRWASWGPAPVEVVEVDRGCAGAARAAGVEHALAGTPSGVSGPGGCWVASTDADSRVPADWLVVQLAAAAHGLGLVVGTVEPDPTIDAHEPVRGRPGRPPWWDAWWATHRLEDGHGHVHGANLGFSAWAYRLVGGFADLPVGEDRDLVARMLRAGVPAWRTDQSRVRTSARLVGRAPAGFADHLAHLAHLGTSA